MPEDKPPMVVDHFTENLDAKVVHHIHYSYTKIMDYEKQMVEMRSRLERLAYIVGITGKDERIKQLMSEGYKKSNM